METIFYRRFILIALGVAVIGVLAAQIVQTHPSQKAGGFSNIGAGLTQWEQRPSDRNNCETRQCSLSRRAVKAITGSGAGFSLA